MPERERRPAPERERKPDPEPPDREDPLDDADDIIDEVEEDEGRHRPDRQ